MSTKVRILVRINGSIQHGGMARRTLEANYKLYGHPYYARNLLRGIPRLKVMFDCMPIDDKAMWLFREPRRIAPEKSRFLKLAKYFRVGGRINSSLEWAGEPPTTPAPPTPSFILRARARAAQADQAARDQAAQQATREVIANVPSQVAAGQSWVYQNYAQGNTAQFWSQGPSTTVTAGNIPPVRPSPSVEDPGNWVPRGDDEF